VHLWAALHNSQGMYCSINSARSTSAPKAIREQSSPAHCGLQNYSYQGNHRGRAAPSDGGMSCQLQSNIVQLPAHRFKPLLCYVSCKERLQNITQQHACCVQCIELTVTTPACQCMQLLRTKTKTVSHAMICGSMLSWKQPLSQKGS
jgi:hypothetical protein